MGYTLDRARSGRGLATEAVARLLDHALGALAWPRSGRSFMSPM
ncbi:hypothetical protein ABZ863_10400 [Saccharomonospora sp. NPDC046836]